MSGIAVDLSRDPAHDAVDAVARMVLRMRSRGLDGARLVSVSGGDVRGAFGHATTWITPEDHGTSQPVLTDQGTAIVFDGRLDERASLLAALGLAASTPDARIVAHAFDRWGETCAARLLGDFAFVVFSRRTGAIFAARDPLGICPLFYWASHGRLRLASEKHALFADGAFEPRPRASMLAVGVIEEYTEREDTFYEGIQSLAPGGTLSFDARGLRLGLHWELDPSRRIAARNGDDAGAMLRETLDAAVRDRMRALGPVAVIVSGGLDSSSVAASAANLARTEGLASPILVTTRYGRGSCDETPFSTRVATHLGLDLAIFDAPREPGSYPPSNDLECGYDPYAQFLEGMAGLIRPSGARVLLGGWGSDELQPFTGYETDQAIHDRDALSAIRWSGVYEDPLAIRPWRRLLGAVKRAIRAPRREMPWGTNDWIPDYATPRSIDHLHVEMAKRSRALERFRGEGPAREIMFAWLLHGMNSPLAVGHHGQLGARLGLSVGQPFFDKRVVELLVGLPMRVMFDRELSKPLLRRAIEPLLPASIAYRTSRPYFMEFFHELLCRERPLFDPLAIDSRLESLGVVEPGTLGRLFSRLEGEQDLMREVMNVVVWEGWLRALEDHLPEPSFNGARSLNENGIECTLW